MTHDAWVRLLAHDMASMIAECDAMGARFTSSWLRTEGPKVLKTIRHRPDIAIPTAYSPHGIPVLPFTP